VTRFQMRRGKRGTLKNGAMLVVRGEERAREEDVPSLAFADCRAPVKSSTLAAREMPRARTHDRSAGRAARV